MRFAISTPRRFPKAGTNISEAIGLAAKTYGKSATGNRALVIFTDGEDLSGDAMLAAKAAADQGVRIFTVGVGTPQGSLIPIKGEDGQSEFVKDEKGQVVKSKLDEKRLREIAETSGGLYLRLENGSRTIQQLILEGIGKMQAGDIDVRLNRRPIERYEWPLGAAILCLLLALLLRERKGQRTPANVVARRAALSATILMGTTFSLFGAAPGIEAYKDGKFEEAYGQFQGTLQAHPQNPAIDRLNFDAGTAAYKLKDYNKAMQSFSQALLSKDIQLQEKTHYNLGNTLYEQGESEKTDDKKLANWTNAIQHFDETIKIDPQNKQAQENREFVKRKIEELKNKKNPIPRPRHRLLRNRINTRKTRTRTNLGNRISKASRNSNRRRILHPRTNNSSSSSNNSSRATLIKKTSRTVPAKATAEKTEIKITRLSLLPLLPRPQLKALHHQQMKVRQHPPRHRRRHQQTREKMVRNPGRLLLLHHHKGLTTACATAAATAMITNLHRLRQAPLRLKIFPVTSRAQMTPNLTNHRPRRRQPKPTRNKEAK